MLNSNSGQRTGAVAKSDIELEPSSAAKANDGTATKKFYVFRRTGKQSVLHNCRFKKSCMLYLVIIVFIWLLHTLPIVVFLSVNAMFFPNETTAAVNNTQKAATQCSRDFFLDNSSGLCRPECGEWDQYSPATRRAVYGVNITFILVTIIVCVVTFVWSIFRHKIMFHYPNIILVYITFTRVLLSILHLVGYTDEKALYCTSRDRVTSFEEGSAYCNIIGSATTFIPTFDLTGLCFHLGTVLFTAYFPFRARKLETRGGYKYLHLVAVVCAVGFSVFLVGLQFAVGGYSRTVVPIFCLAASESAFVFGVIPACLISAIFLTFVMALFFKIIDMQGWKSKPSQPKEQNATTSEPQTTSSANRYTSAQIKLVLIFCTQGFATIINYSAYSVVLKMEDAFSQASEEYLNCEGRGNVNEQCDRSSFEELDPTPTTFPLTTITYVLLPLSTLIYVANVEKLFSMCKTRFKIFTTKSTGSSW